MMNACLRSGGLAVVFLLLASTVSAGEITVKWETEFLTSERETFKTIGMFYDDGQEVARQESDKYGNIIDQKGAIPDGNVRTYYKSGALQSETEYKDNLPNGVSKNYYLDGTMHSQQHFKNGKPDGPSTIYFENGKILMTAHYREGQYVGQQVLYDQEGNVITTINHPEPLGGG